MNRLATTAAIILLSACRDSRVIQPTLALPRPGSNVPEFSFTLTDSSLLSPATLRGRSAVLFLWSTHCPTSRRALAEYRALQRDYAGRAEIVLVSDDASRDELALLPRVLQDSAVSGRVALARGRLARVFDQSRAAPERDTARISFVLPAYLILDSTGVIVARSWGPDAGLVRAALDSMSRSRPAT